MLTKRSRQTLTRKKVILETNEGLKKDCGSNSYQTKEKEKKEREGWVREKEREKETSTNTYIHVYVCLAYVGL